MLCSMLDRPWGPVSENLSSDRSQDTLKLVEQKAFGLVNKEVQWQAKLACQEACRMCVIMVGGTVG